MAQRLVAKENDLVIMKGLFYDLNAGLVQGLRQINTADLGANVDREFLDLDIGCAHIFVQLER
jgi:hypothetical protein